MIFQKKLELIQDKNNSLLCVGLDADFGKLPAKFKKLKNSQFEFNKYIIKETREYVCAYKPNSAFYEARGDKGIRELKLTCDYLTSHYPEIPIILDAKRADIGNTNMGYAQFAFKYLGTDAITLHPYLGQEAIQPFLDYKDKGSIILCRTSNDGAGEFQDFSVVDPGSGAGMTIWEKVAQSVSKKWNKNKNCMLVMGATYPKELAKVRKIVGEMTLLVPGIGAQGGDLKAVLKVALNKNKKGLIINSSRGIIFAQNPKLAAKKLREQINQNRESI